MNTIIEKVSNSRDILLEILNEYGWDISKVPNLSVNEIEQIYNIENNKNSIYSSFGIAAGCNFVLTHENIPSHKLHVIYYNMPLYTLLCAAIPYSNRPYANTICATIRCPSSLYAILPALTIRCTTPL